LIRPVDDVTISRLRPDFAGLPCKGFLEDHDMRLGARAAQSGKSLLDARERPGPPRGKRPGQAMDIVGHHGKVASSRCREHGWLRRVKRASDCQNFMRLSLINFSSETPGERETRILTQKICAQCGYGRSLTSKP
jgi:hypothetical protein